MAAGTIVSLQEYLQTSYRPDCDYVDGVLVGRNVGEIQHSRWQGEIYATLRAQGKKLGLTPFVELRVRISDTRYRVPDVCMIEGSGPDRGPLTSPPFLCVEVLSPEDRFSTMHERIHDYLGLGVPFVWIVDPLKRQGWICTPDSMVEAPDGILRTTNPSITITIAELDD
ncbi:MAG TPA: Uma2 family endonuclease [Bryobacteraceae bacterium]|nr:Uma2 family endonuclease [Bryobacteraceae bacterium]